MQPPKDQVSVSRPDDYRAGYQAAITLWTQEGAQVWSKFTAMVYAHTVIIVTIGVSLAAPRAGEFRLFRTVLCLLGLLLCGAWALISRRSFYYLDYYIRSAREIEERHLSDTVCIVSRGGELFSDEGVEFVHKDGDRHKLVIRPNLLNKVAIRHIIYFIIVVFGLLYIFAILQS